jgi:hypothetical protein
MTSLLATSDILQLSPNFGQAVVNVHNVLLGVAFVVAFAGFVMVAIQAQRERAVHEIWPAMIRICIIALFLGNMGAIGNALSDAVTDVETAAGVSGNPMQAFVAAIQQKFGVTLSGIIGPISPGGTATIAGGTGTAAPGSTTITHFSYPGDSTPDPNSEAGIGNHQNQMTPYTGGTAPASAALTASAAQAYGVPLGGTFTVTSTTGTQYNLIYDDTAPESDLRVDIFDPNGLLPGGNNWSQVVASENAGATAPTTAGGNLGDFANGLLHPVETAQIAFLGMFTLVLSYVAAFIQWFVALIQSVLFYAEIAVAPIFVGFLLVRGLEHFAKTFILSFIAICLWRLAFLITGLISQLLLGLAVNSGNAPALGAANAVNPAGATYLWLICVALVVIFGSIVGPWMISKRFVAGASGVSELLFGAGYAGIRAAQITSGAVGTVHNYGSASQTNGMPSPMYGGRLSAQYARRPVSKRSNDV